MSLVLTCRGCWRSRAYETAEGVAEAKRHYVEQAGLCEPCWKATDGRCPTCGGRLPGALSPSENSVTVRRGATATEKAAALRALPNSGTARGHILALVARFGGLTDDEIETTIGLPHQSASARRRELVLGGWLNDSGDTRATRTGAAAIVWKPTERALARLREGEA